MKEDKKPDNPKAFPVNSNTSIYNTGMTLRDYFAAKAMQGFISGSSKLTLGPDESDNDILSVVSYSVADEMLKQREL